MSGFCICIGDCKNVLYLDVGHKIGVNFFGVHAIFEYGLQNSDFFGGKCNTHMWVTK
jgi:hypothetical protein